MSAPRERRGTREQKGGLEGEAERNGGVGGGEIGRADLSEKGTKRPSVSSPNTPLPLLTDPEGKYLSS